MFNSAGWVFKLAKRSGNPSQECRYLGLIINSKDMTFNVPAEKIEAMEVMLGKMKLEASKRRAVPVRKLARLVGKLQSFRLATGPIVSVLTRSLYAAISSCSSWSAWIKIDDLAFFELDWWEKNLRNTSKFPISAALTTFTTEHKVASDASDIGHYVYLTGKVPRMLAGRAFTQEEQEQSSTWRELKAFHDCWTNPKNLSEFANKHVAHYTDNKSMVFIIEKGSRNRKLHPMIVEATLALRRHGISMQAMWVSREEGIIALADMGSRDYDRDDISLDFASMAEIYEAFGDFQWDGFATATTSKGKKFFSRRQSPGSSGVNFFHQQLSPEESIFCFPPTRLLVAALHHVKFYQAKAVFVVPVWPASTFYSIFWPDGTHALQGTQKMLIMNPFFVCGPLVTSHVMRGRAPYRTAILEVNFNRGASQSPRRERCLKGGCKKCY